MARVADLIGFDVARGGWAAANAVIGPGQTHRIFYSSNLPTTFDGDSTPSNVTMIVSYKSVNTNVAAYVNSIPGNRNVILIYHHEPEGDYSLGSQFVSEFKSQSDLIRAQGRTNVRVAMCAAGYPYRNAGSSDVLAGNYLRGLGPYVDMFTKDIYQGAGGTSGSLWPSNGLANYDQWTNWLNLVTSTSVVGTVQPLGITEYGIDDPVGNTARNTRLSLDGTYLTNAFTPGGASAVSPFPLQLWCYWWQDKPPPDPNQSQFTDSATITTWQGFENASTGGGAGSPYLVGSASLAINLSTSLTMTVTTPTAAGDVIVVTAVTASSTVSSVTDTKSNVYTQRNSDAGGLGNPTYQFTADGSNNTGGTKALTTSDTITVTWASAAPAKQIIAVACSGLAASPIDQAVNADSAGSTAPSVTSGVLATTGEVAIASQANGSGGGAITWGAGWTQLWSAENQNTGPWAGVAYQTGVGTAAVTASGTIVSAKWTMELLTLKPPGGTAPGVTMTGELDLTESASAVMFSGMTGALNLTEGATATLTAVPPPPFPGSPLGVKIELLINGTWTDITRYAYVRDGITITRGRPDEATTVGPSTATFTLNNRGGDFSPRNPGGVFYPFLGRNTQLRISAQNDATLAAYTYRFWGEVSVWPPLWDLSGNDVYVQVTASGVLRRLSQGSSLGSALRRYYTRLPGAAAPAAYWPCEDGSASLFLSPAAVGANAMTFTGTPSLAADSTFGGSDPIPQLNSSVWTGTTNSFGSSGDDVFQTPGTFTWTCPGGTTSVDVRCWGGGGGGAPGTSNGGGGGGGGELAEETAYTVIPGNVYQVIVGPGGTQGGGAGGTSSFDGKITAHGGLGASGSTGAAGGTGSTNGSHHDGGAGAAGATGSAGSQTWTSPGNHTWKAPPGVTTVTARCWGGGGGGQAGTQSNHAGRCGGGGGEYAQQAVAVTPGTVYTVQVGSGGAGGSGSQLANGSGGGHSIFTGDSVTVDAHGGGGAINATSGASGTGSSNTVNHDGGAGGSFSFTNGGGGGAGSGGTSGAGRDGGRSPGRGGGAGATAVSGGGPGGHGGSSTSKAGKTPSSGPGGGGGGGAGDTGGWGNGGKGAAGQVKLTWAVSGAGGGGGGGGGSGGTAVAGNTAAGQPGAPAVTNGGPGGDGGQATDGGTPFNGPGGGGGGGDGTTSPPDFTGGNGYAGQVEIIYAPSVTPNSNVLRFLLNIPAASQPPDGAVIARMLTAGTVRQVDVAYHTGGSLQLTGYGTGTTVLFDSGPKTVHANGFPMLVSAELTATGSSVRWTLAAIGVGAAAPIGSWTGTVTGTIGSATTVTINPAGTITDTSVGHITVQYAADPLATVAATVGGYASESAADRFTRLLAEENLTGIITGNAQGDTGYFDAYTSAYPGGTGGLATAAMGPQRNDTLLNLLQQCEDVDGGQIYEDRNSFALAYRPFAAMTGQAPDVTLDYSASQVSPPLAPTEDDQMTRNDVTVTRVNGSSAQAQLTTGPLSVLDPPAGVGRYSYATTVNCYDDSQPPGIAQRILARGTVDEERYPVITVNLAHPAAATVFAAMAALDAGDFLQIINPPPWLPSGPISQLAFGFTETLNVKEWKIAVNCVPESSYG